MTDDLAMQPATRLLELFETRAVSPVDVAKAALGRIDRLNPAINAICFIREEETLAMAAASEARWMTGDPVGLLDGIPVTVKDVMAVNGWPTRRGSRVVSPMPAAADVPMVARLREAGAVLVGKTTTAEFGWKGVTDNSLTGVTRNPWNLARTPAGSSGGAAAAVAVGIGALATGSDAAGSIRMPASFCGVYGLKPSYGAVPTYPMSSFGTLSHSGPITRTVADAALMMTVVGRPSVEGAATLPTAGMDYRSGLNDGVAGLRIAYSADLGSAKVDNEVRELAAAAVNALSDLGAEVEEVGAIFEEPRRTIDVLWQASLVGILAQYDEEQQRLIDPDMVAMARRPPVPNLLDYLHVGRERVVLAAQMQRFHQRYDLLATPAVPVPAFPAGQLLADPESQTSWLDWSPFCYPFNLTGQPAASVPCGFTAAGLPVGLQIVGALYDDLRVLRASRALEVAMPPSAPPMASA